jgi:hypothetical protein
MICRTPGDMPGDNPHYQHISMIVPGQPWYSPVTASDEPTPATRKITQIAGGTDGDDYPKVVWALCSDGTLWSYIGHPQYSWERQLDIPGD